MKKLLYGTSAFFKMLFGIRAVQLFDGRLGVDILLSALLIVIILCRNLIVFIKVKIKIY